MFPAAWCCVTTSCDTLPFSIVVFSVLTHKYSKTPITGPYFWLVNDVCEILWRPCYPNPCDPRIHPLRVSVICACGSYGVDCIPSPRNWVSYLGQSSHHSINIWWRIVIDCPGLLTTHGISGPLHMIETAILWWTLPCWMLPWDRPVVDKSSKLTKVYFFFKYYTTYIILDGNQQYTSHCTKFYNI